MEHLRQMWQASKERLPFPPFLGRAYALIVETTFPNLVLISELFT